MRCLTVPKANVLFLHVCISCVGAVVLTGVCIDCIIVFILQQEERNNRRENVGRIISQQDKICKFCFFIINTIFANSFAASLYLLTKCV